MKSKSPFGAVLAVKIPSASLRTVPLKSIDVRGVKLPARIDPKVVTLVESIGEVGQLAPILVDEDLKLISGRHRFVAHQVLKLDKIDVKVSDLDELGLQLARIDENLVRQTYTALERAEALAERKRIYEAMHPTAKRGGDRSKLRPAESARGFAKDTSAKTGAGESTIHEYVAVAEKLDPEAKAKIASTPAGDSIKDLTRLARLDPEVQRQVAALVSMDPENTSVKSAVKGLRQQAALKNVLTYTPPVGTYAVIVTDVSWEYDDKLDGSDEARGGVDYATQKLDEILAMKMPAAPDCALWFFVTNAFLIDGTAARVLETWGFKPKALLTWRKVDKAGNDRLGSGHYLQNNTEHVILAVRGKPVIMGAGVPSCFDAPRTSRHSEKPDEAFRIFEKVTPCAPGARIELFAIKPREGWQVSGSEQQATAREARGDRPPAVDPGPAEEAEVVDPTAERAGYIDRLHAQGWEPLTSAGGGWGRVISDTHWLVDSSAERTHPNTPWAAYRPQTETRPHHHVGDFATIEEAVAAIERKAARTPPPPAVPGGEKPRKTLIVEPDAPPAPNTSGSQIEWVDKKHPTVVAIGTGYAGRRYEIRRESKRSLQGKKIDGHNYRWFCGRDGSLQDFDTLHAAKDDALRVERSWLVASGRRAS